MQPTRPRIIIRVELSSKKAWAYKGRKFRQIAIQRYSVKAEMSRFLSEQLVLIDSVEKQGLYSSSWLCTTGNDSCPNLFPDMYYV